MFHYSYSLVILSDLILLMLSVDFSNLRVHVGKSIWIKHTDVKISIIVISVVKGHNYGFWILLMSMNFRLTMSTQDCHS